MAIVGFTLDQRSPNFSVRGPRKVMQNICRGPDVLRIVIVAKYVIFCQINKVFVSILYIIFSSLTKWIRGQDEMAPRAVSDPWAIVLRPLL